MQSSGYKCRSNQIFLRNVVLEIKCVNRIQGLVKHLKGYPTRFCILTSRPPLFVSKIIKCIQTRKKEKRRKERKKSERGQGRRAGARLPLGGSVAEWLRWLGCWTSSPWVSGSNPTLSTSWICFTAVPSYNSFGYACK